MIAFVAPLGTTKDPDSGEVVEGMGEGNEKVVRVLEGIKVDGTAVGVKVGILLGVNVGRAVGTNVGTVGFAVGSMVGTEVGERDGM